MSEIPPEVCVAYALGPAAPTRVPSLINRTFLAKRGDSSPLIVQRLHPTFAPEVNLDIEAVTGRLRDAGLETPTLLRTIAGEAWVIDGQQGVWRALSYVEGEVIHTIQHPSQARSAGALIGRFHLALAGLNHGFLHVRPGAHDTPQHLSKLRRVQSQATQASNVEIADLAAQILEASAKVQVDFSGLPRRVTHGDLKISNLLFWADRPREARCLIDLDTLGLQHIAYELGDALRSWCNPAGENLTQPDVDLEIFRATLSGYAEAAPGFLLPSEVVSVVDGLQTISLELSARFAVDALDDHYFGWDEQRFASRREHNLVRARGQLALSNAVTARKVELVRLAKDLFAAAS